MAAVVLAPSMCGLATPRTVRGCGQRMPSSFMPTQLGRNMAPSTLGAGLSACSTHTSIDRHCVLGQTFSARSRCSSSGSESDSPQRTPRLPVQCPGLVAHPAIIGDGCRGASPGISGGLERAVSSGKAQGKSGLIIWFHYLGGSGSDWEQCLKSKIAQQLPWVEWQFPDAPKRAVTNYDGAMVPAWFDQLEGQVSERMSTPGLEESVATVHALIRQAEAQGIPANRIMLGGMSQGGVLAVAAGLSFEKPLAGVIAVSSWVPSHLLAKIRQPSTPLFLGNGDRDEVVPVDVFLHGAKSLERTGCNRISKKQYPGLTHTFADYEKDDIRHFVSTFLPNLVQPSSAPFGGIHIPGKFR